MNRKQRREIMRQMQSEDLNLEVVHPHAAGIDIGNASHYVAVPPSRDPQPVRCFGCTTAELKTMAEWLKQCGIRTVAMQSTGVYWIAVYEILEEAGLEVYLVNARETKNLPGRKTDVQESQWLMKLHTYGLLRNSFRPSQDIRTLRTYWRQRQDLVRSTGRHIQRMQKALTQMNIQLANVISDISGVTGQAILKAILDGQRDPRELAAYRDCRVEASEEEIAQALEGNWQEDQLFVLRQEQAGYEFCQKQITECDQQLAQYLARLEDRTQGATLPEETRKGRRKKKKGNPQFNLRERVVSHDRYGPDPDRWHRCHDGDDGCQRSRMGYEQVEDREPFCFLAEAVSGQQNQWGQTHWERSHAHQQPRDHCLKDGGHYFTGERQLFRGAVPPISDSAGASGGDQGDGRQTRPARLPHAALRNEICGPRSRVL